LKKVCSFLKKRTKRLLFLGCTAFSGHGRQAGEVRRNKSLLLLFFRKEGLLLFLSLPGPARAEEFKISTWNLNWLTTRTRAEASLPGDVQMRAPEDFARLRAYAVKLAADVVAFQEVDGAATASLIFDPKTYAVVTIDETVVQRVGLAVRRSISVLRNPDLTALDVEPAEKFPLRDGLDVTLGFPGGARLRVLVVHLKTGCQIDVLRRSRRPQCGLLARQVPVLAAWVAARRAEESPFMVLGDFNRVFDAPEEFGAALAAAAPLTRVTAGYENPCWNGAPFIDHIFLGGKARSWLEPGSLRVQIFREAGASWKQRLSDHCPVSVRLDVPQQR